MTQTSPPTKSAPALPPPPFDVQRIRADFPALHQEFRGKSLVYMDNAASCQTPQPVLDAMMSFYTTMRANIHRGVHTMSQQATRAYEDARLKLQRFLHASESRELIFVRGATEGINLVAQAYARPTLQPGDEIIISAMEHHSNIVPWQMICAQTGAKLRVVPMDTTGAFDMEAYKKTLSETTKFVSVVHVSNALGTINPVHQIVKLAHEFGAPVLLDGAQAAPHATIDVQDIDCDFYVLSGHKLYGPTGVGILYGKAKYLEAMDPYHGGGDMIRSVTFEKSEYAEIPAKFEAGTPHIAGGIALGAAVDYLEAIGMDNIATYEDHLLQYGTQLLQDIPGVKLVGTAPQKAAVLSFTIDGIHPHDIGTILDMDGIAVRSGHHCAQPVMDFFEVPATARASLACYNTYEELDRLAEGIRKVIRMFS